MENERMHREQAFDRASCRWAAAFALLAYFLLVAAVPLAAQDAAPAEKSTTKGAGLEGGDRTAIERVVRDYILENPGIVVEALQAYEAQRQRAEQERRQAALAQYQDQLLRDPEAPVIGNPEGDVTLVEFFDYRCPYCRSFGEQLVLLLERDPQVRVVMKEFPILSRESIEAARAALAADRQGGYRAFHFALLEEPGDLSREHILATADRVGLDRARLERDMRDPAIDDILRRNYQLAEALGIDGTPAIVIGEQIHAGALPLDRLTEAIAAARAGEKPVAIQ